MSEEEILNDLSTHKFEISTIESLIGEVKISINELNNVKDRLELIKLDKHWKNITDLITMTLILMTDNEDNAFSLIFENKKYIPIVDLYILILNDCKSLDFQKTKPHPAELTLYNRMTLNERKIYLLSWLNLMLNRLVAKSEELGMYAIQNGIIERLLNVLADKNFIDQMETYNPGNLGLFIANINCLTLNVEEEKSRWHKADAIRILTNLLNDHPEYSINLYSTMVDIAFDKDLEKLVEMNDIIDRLVAMILQGVENRNKMPFTTEIIDQVDQTQHKFELMQIVDEKSMCTFPVSDFVKTLYRIAVNDKTKKILYAKPGLTQAVKKFFNTGCKYEQNCSLEYISQLCFDEQIKQEIRKDLEFLSKVKMITTDSSKIKYKSLVKSSQQLIWLLEKDKEAMLKNDNIDDQHIMISYNRDSRELCLKIKQKLEEMGYRIWIDVSDIRGSTLEAMAEAVENASCVLMCVTEKYRQSVNCQAEAQFSFKLQKKIVPLIMQEGYGNVGGWLGLIMGDKMFVDFTKYSYDECIRRLLKEIDSSNHISKSIFQITSVKTNEPNNQNELMSSKENDINSEVKRWDENQVENWFKQMKIDLVYEALKPLDGEILHQLYEFKTYTPEFFFKSISKHESMDLKQASQFSLYLTKLFKSSN